MEEAIVEAVQILRSSTPIMVFSGAGISTESGIPDFRGPNGLWTKLDPDDFTIGRYLADVEIRRRSWKMFVESRNLGGPIEPNPAHRAVTNISRLGFLSGCVTQNIDGLHQAAGLTDEEVVELHGHVREVRCVDCRTAYPTDDVLARVSTGEDDPRCLRCSGILKSATVMFGEFLPVKEMERAWRFAEAAGSVLAIGSTLSVFPAADIPLSIASSGRPLVIVNLGPTEADDLAALRIEGKAGEVLPRLVTALAMAG